MKAIAAEKELEYEANARTFPIPQQGDSTAELQQEAQDTDGTETQAQLHGRSSPLSQPPPEEVQEAQDTDGTKTQAEIEGSRQQEEDDQLKRLGLLIFLTLSSYHILIILFIIMLSESDVSSPPTKLHPTENLKDFETILRSSDKLPEAQQEGLLIFFSLYCFTIY